MLQSRTSWRSDLASSRFSTALLSMTWLVVVDLLFTWCRLTDSLILVVWLILMGWVLDLSSCQRFAVFNRASGNRYFALAYGTLVLYTPGPKSVVPVDVLTPSCRHFSGMWSAWALWSHFLSWSKVHSIVQSAVPFGYLLLHTAPAKSPLSLSKIVLQTLFLQLLILQICQLFHSPTIVSIQIRILQLIFLQTLFALPILSARRLSGSWQMNLSKLPWCSLEAPMTPTALS